MQIEEKKVVRSVNCDKCCEAFVCIWFTVLVFGILAGFGMYCYQINEFRERAKSFDNDLSECRRLEYLFCEVERNSTTCLPKMIECVDISGNAKTERQNAFGMGMGLFGVIPICICLIYCLVHACEENDC